MAPESVFDRMYTHKSDVWSFGIMCWEMLELGQKPYTNMTLTSVPSAVALGHRLARPQLCTPQLYEDIIQKIYNFIYRFHRQVQNSASLLAQRPPDAARLYGNSLSSFNPGNDLMQQHPMNVMRFI